MTTIVEDVEAILVQHKKDHARAEIHRCMGRIILEMGIADLLLQMHSDKETTRQLLVQAGDLVDQAHREFMK